MALDKTKIIQVDFSEQQYVKEEQKKKTIVLHHTVSGDGAMGDINYWKTTPERIATAIVIERSGAIYQCFSSKYWAAHLGIKTEQFSKFGLPNINVKLDKQSIGIELDSWGALVKHTDNEWYGAIWDGLKGKYVPNLKVKIAKQNVIEFPNGFRGFYGFEKYTDAQIQSAKDLIQYWSDNYNIATKYNEDMWDVSQNALSGASGIFTHCSFRSDKSDCSPQPNLINMLKSL